MLNTSVHHSTYFEIWNGRVVMNNEYEEECRSIYFFRLFVYKIPMQLWCGYEQISKVLLSRQFFAYTCIELNKLKEDFFRRDKF